MSHDKPLDSTWDDPLPHALTRVRTYLGPPCRECDVAIIAIHGRGDNARDFCDVFVPHLRQFFKSTLEGEVDEDDLTPFQTAREDARLTIRALEAQDAAWFLGHKSQIGSDIAFQGPYIYGSLQKLRSEIEFLNSRGIPNHKIILVGYSQGAIMINTYLIKALEQIASSKSKPAALQVTDQLPIPAKFLAWAGTTFSFGTHFPIKAWPYLEAATSDADSKPSTNQTEEIGFSVESHQQCGLSDRYFTQQEIEDVAAKIANASSKAFGPDEAGIKVSLAMEPGIHAVLPGMIARLIQMIQDVLAQP
ncbi:hypothetical protein BCV70DRAFT_203061 [Testicularia cyperi]|uniref:Alpha/beta-hydrolase n=1 Tax=Testicularia cyperi TaxID=1882483 RepID=A0A317XFP6_9BASI|nr:hypothetical protein BCV70DRAFT_203061 [Testicularia cyperi]